MATYTDFLNLELPAGSDYYNVGVTNANFQKLAAFLSGLSAEQVAYLNAAMDGVENVKQALDAQQVDLANKVNMGQPQLYDLPLASGISWVHHTYYYKTAFNQVFIHLDIQKSSGNFIDGEVFAVLPEGFRPPSTLNFNPVYWGGGATLSPYTPLGISRDGVITGIAGFNRVRGSFNFMATH